MSSFRLPGAKALEIERHEFEPEFAKLPSERLAGICFGQSLDGGYRDFDPCQIALMKSDAALRQTKLAEQILGGFDAGGALGRHGHSRSDPARQARRRGLLGDRQPPLSRKFADGRFAETEFLERMPHAVLGRGDESRPIIAEIVQIRAAANHIKPQIDPQGDDSIVQLALAMVTAATVIANVVRIGKFIRADDDVPDADLLGDPARPRDPGGQRSGCPP